MALEAKRITVGTDPVDLAEDTPVGGQVAVQALCNRGKTSLFIGDADNGYEIGPGERFPASLNLGSSDKLYVVRESGEGPVDLVLGYA